METCASFYWLNGIALEYFQLAELTAMRFQYLDPYCYIKVFVSKTLTFKTRQLPKILPETNPNEAKNTKPLLNPQTSPF